jgi:hypothetical protein
LISATHTTVAQETSAAKRIMNLSIGGFLGSSAVLGTMFWTGVG